MIFLLPRVFSRVYFLFNIVKQVPFVTQSFPESVSMQYIPILFIVFKFHFTKFIIPIFSCKFIIPHPKSLLLIFNNLIVMKRPKSDKPVVPISLSAKKPKGDRLEHLFTPYKIEWKQPTPIENKDNSSSKSFFSSMKNQLSTIKMDVEKLIKKQNQKTENKSQAKPQEVIEVMKNINKKYMNEKLKDKENEDRQRRQPLAVINEAVKNKEIEKSLMCEKQKTSILTKELYVNKKILEEKQKAEEQFRRQIKIQKSIIDQLKKEQKDLSIQNQDKNTIIMNLRREVAQVKFKKQQESTYYKQQISSLINKSQAEESKVMVEEMRNHNTFLQSKIQELSVELNIITGKFNDREIYIKGLQSKNENFSKSQKSLEQKISKSQYSTKKMEQIIDSKEKENKILKNEIEQLHKILSQKQKEIEKDRVENVSNTSSLHNLSKEFETKINTVLDENYQLKNTINKLQADIEKIQIEKNMLSETIRKFQERDTMTSRTRLDKDQRMELYEQIENIKKQKQDIIEEYEYKLMKLQNQYDQIRKVNGPKEPNSQVDNYFNKILKEQLSQNQLLKEKLKESQLQIFQLKEEIKDVQFKKDLLQNELSTEKLKMKNLQNNQRNSSSAQEESLKSDLKILQSKYESICSILESKNKQIKMKDDFIQRALISKINKKQDEDEVSYLMNELKVILP